MSTRRARKDLAVGLFRDSLNNLCWIDIDQVVLGGSSVFIPSTLFLSKILDKQDSQYQQLLQIGRREWGVVISEICRSASSSKAGVQVRFTQVSQQPALVHRTLVQLAHKVDPFKEEAKKDPSGIEIQWPLGHAVQASDVLDVLEDLCSVAEQLQQQGWPQPAAVAASSLSSLGCQRITRSMAAAAAVCAGASSCAMSDACNIPRDDASSSRARHRRYCAQQSGGPGRPVAPPGYASAAAGSGLVEGEAGHGQQAVPAGPRLGRDAARSNQIAPPGAGSLAALGLSPPKPSPPRVVLAPLQQQQQQQQDACSPPAACADQQHGSKVAPRPSASAATGVPAARRSQHNSWAFLSSSGNTSSRTDRSARSSSRSMRWFAVADQGGNMAAGAQAGAGASLPHGKTQQQAQEGEVHANPGAQPAAAPAAGAVGAWAAAVQDPHTTSSSCRGCRAAGGAAGSEQVDQLQYAPSSQATGGASSKQRRRFVPHSNSIQAAAAAATGSANQGPGGSAQSDTPVRSSFSAGEVAAAAAAKAEGPPDTAPPPAAAASQNGQLGAAPRPPLPPAAAAVAGNQPAAAHVPNVVGAAGAAVAAAPTPPAQQVLTNPLQMFDFDSQQPFRFLASTATSLLVPANDADNVVLHLRPMGLLGEGGMSVVVRVQAVQLTGSLSDTFFISSSVQEAATAAACSKDAPRTFALKVMKRCSDLPPTQMVSDYNIEQQVRDEWRALHACRNSSFIVKGHAVGWVTLSRGDMRPCVLMDVADGGSLQSVVDSSGALSHQQAWEVMKRIIRALWALNKMASYVHRDLKLANVLLLSPGDMTSAVLSDFGLSEHVPHPGLPSRRQVHTPGYQTPDVQPGRSHGAAVDVFLLGLLLVHMVTGDIPFSYVPGNLNQREVSRRTPQELDNPDCPYVRDRLITPAEKAFLQETFVTDPALRLTLLELLAHPYLVSGPGALGDWP